MRRFDLVRKDDGGYQLRVPKEHRWMLRFPLYNKGTGFTAAERERFGLDGLLPAQLNSIETQAERVYRSIMFNKDPVGRHIDLAALHDRNEHLFYKVLQLHLEELMPIVYTPTVGKASEYFSRVFRGSRGIWITPDHVGRIESVLRHAAPYSGVQLMVVTDNESILGIGDQGAGGMAISIGKLSLYCAGAGIHPVRTLPISLDVGTNNQALLGDPLYLGWRQPRLRGEKYLEILDEFVSAAKNVFPNVVIQWEDFRKDNALLVLRRYEDQVPSFNDDIQGTGAVAFACMHAANRITGGNITDSRVLIYGAGAAGYGIAKRIMAELKFCGLHGEALRRSVIAMDSKGILAKDQEHNDYKEELAWPREWIAALGLSDDQCGDLASVISAFKPNVLIGTSGQAGTFDEPVVRAMAAGTERPVILPMSNPTTISEAIPEDVLRWTGGKALVATGSPFEDVPMRGGIQRIGQANNVFIFPGIGLGTIVSGATKVTDGMIGAASQALAGSLTEAELAGGVLIPEVSRLWDVCGEVAAAVGKRAIEDGVAPETEHADLVGEIENYRWHPDYPEIVDT